MSMKDSIIGGFTKTHGEPGGEGTPMTLDEWREVLHGQSKYHRGKLLVNGSLRGYDDYLKTLPMGNHGRPK